MRATMLDHECLVLLFEWTTTEKSFVVIKGIQFAAARRQFYCGTRTEARVGVALV